MSGYTTSSYGWMLQDTARVNAYVEALRKVIEPGVTTVLELGTGTGVVAFAAIQAGAKKVWALEPNDAIQVAREIARANNIDGIEFIQKLSTDVDLPPADVMLSDMRGVMPLLSAHIPSIVDARARLLRDGGVQIARADDLYFAPIEAPKTWQEKVGFWADNFLNLDMRSAQHVSASCLCRVSDEEQTITDPVHWARLDYRTVESPDVAKSATCEVLRTATIHGIRMWFETQLDDEITLSTAPSEPRLAYGRPMLPLLDPIEVRKGEQLEIELKAKLVGGDYVWMWRGRVVGDSSREFAHSTLDGGDLSLDKARRLRLDATPARSEAAERLHFALNLLDGVRPLSELSELFAERWGEAPSAAMRYISDVVLRHGR